MPPTPRTNLRGSFFQFFRRAGPQHAFKKISGTRRSVYCLNLSPVRRLQLDKTPKNEKINEKKFSGDVCYQASCDACYQASCDAQSTKKLNLAFFSIFGGVLRTAAKNRKKCLMKTWKLKRVHMVKKVSLRLENRFNMVTKPFIAFFSIFGGVLRTAA